MSELNRWKTDTEPHWEMEMVHICEHHIMCVLNFQLVFVNFFIIVRADASDKRDGKDGQGRNEDADMTEPWMQERVRQDCYERWLHSRPRCVDCAEPILEERALRLEEGLLCEACRIRRTVAIEEME